MSNNAQLLSSRRHFLAQNAMGIGSVALAWLLQRKGLLAKPVKPNLEAAAHTLLPKQPHHAPRAKAMISCFMQGGPSQMDICDPKPQLDEWVGRDFPKRSSTTTLHKPAARCWPANGSSKSTANAAWTSASCTGFSEVADELCLIRSMHTGVNNHGQSIHAMNSGRTVKGRPALGSWLTYGLGTENQNLPAYMVLRDPANIPVEGVLNWSPGFLPSLYQGTLCVRANRVSSISIHLPNYRGSRRKTFWNF